MTQGTGMAGVEMGVCGKWGSTLINTEGGGRLWGFIEGNRITFEMEINKIT